MGIRLEFDYGYWSSPLYPVSQNTRSLTNPSVTVGQRSVALVRRVKV
jgi:hypothetical protein